MSVKKKVTDSERVHGVVSSFHKYVVVKLVGIKGTSESDVVGKILDDWITRNVDFLEKAGITVEEWRKSLEE